MSHSLIITYYPFILERKDERDWRKCNCLRFIVDDHTSSIRRVHMVITSLILSLFHRLSTSLSPLLFLLFVDKNLSLLETV